MHTEFVQYEARLLRVGASGYTLRNMRRSAAVVKELVGERPLESVEPWEWEELWGGLPGAVSSKRLHLTTLRCAMRYAAKRRGVPLADPTFLVELPRARRREKTILSSEYLRELEDRCRTRRQRLLWAGLAFTGMRRSEVESVRWEAVNLQRQIITIVGKGGHERRVPIHPTLGEALVAERYHLGARVFPNVRDALDAIGHCGGAHVFRRTVTSSLDRNGVQRDVVDAIMGWAPLQVHDRHYRHVHDDELVTAICRLYANDPV